MPPLLPVTRNLMIVCLVFQCLEQFFGGILIQLFALWPVQTGAFWPWQVLTYAFLHEPSDWTHLIFNMLGLWMFGIELEALWGPKRYLQFLAAAAVAGALTQLLLSVLFGGYSPVIGASGAIFGLLLANGMLFPRRPIQLFFVIPMDMRSAVFVFGAIELFMGVSGRGSGAMVAHFAHLGGMLGGWLMILWWRRRPPRFRRVK